MNYQQEKITDIKKAVAKAWGATLREIESTSKIRHVAEARQAAMAMCVERLKMTYSQTSKAFCRNCHATAAHAVQVHQRRNQCAVYATKFEIAEKMVFG